MPLVLGVPTLGVWELLIILVIIIAIFGAGKVAGVGGAIGGSIREFKKAVHEGEEDTTNATTKLESTEKGEQRAS
jgi:sec-independent protein translocase protein TatA